MLSYSFFVSSEVVIRPGHDGISRIIEIIKSPAVEADDKGSFFHKKPPEINAKID